MRFASEEAAGDAPHSVNSLELGVHLVGSLVVVLCGDLIELSALQEKKERGRERGKRVRKKRMCEILEERGRVKKKKKERDDKQLWQYPTETYSHFKNKKIKDESQTHFVFFFFGSFNFWPLLYERGGMLGGLQQQQPLPQAHQLGPSVWKCH